MRHPLTRRGFLATSAATAIGFLATNRLDARLAVPRSMKKALIGAPSRPFLERLKAAGFDGMESNQWNIAPDEAAEQRAVAEELGMKIHSVMRGWTDFNHADPANVAAGIASVKTSLLAAQAFGADAVLLVPCRLLSKVAYPKPEEFSIEFNEETGYVTQVVKGDNTPFREYIREQNHAIETSRKALESLIPVAEKTGVVIALENVWSNFWVKPKLFAHFTRSFRSPWIQSYFDIGNHVKYAEPEAWIQALGKTIVKVHVKDFTIDRSAPRGGSFVDIREGDVNWPSVMNALDGIGYQGWMTIEGSGRLSDEEKSKRLDMILAGK